MQMARQQRSLDLWDLVIAAVGYCGLWFRAETFSVIGVQLDSAAKSSLATTMVVLVTAGLIIARRTLMGRAAEILTSLGFVRPANGWGQLRKDLKVAAAALIFSLLLWAVSEEIGWASSYSAGTLSDGGISQLLATLLILAVLVPVAEELMFRGVIFGCLRRWLTGYYGFAVSAAVSAVLFALGHGLPQDPKFYQSLATGLAAAYVYWRSGSLVSAFVVHGLFNGLAAVLFLGDWLIYQ